MEPGRELDKLVAEAMGYADFWQDPGSGWWYAYMPNAHLEDDRVPILEYSTDGYAAWEAWGWLEENNPWNGSLILCRLHRQQGFDPCVGLYGEDHIIAWGETYPHAIALAVLATKEAGDVQG